MISNVCLYNCLFKRHYRSRYRADDAYLALYNFKYGDYTLASFIYDFATHARLLPPVKLIRLASMHELFLHVGAYSFTEYAVILDYLECHALMKRQIQVWL